MKTGGIFETAVEQHPEPYTYRWIQKGPTIKAVGVSRVPLFISRCCSPKVLYDMADMDASHILLGYS